MSQEESKSSLRSRVDGEKARYLTRQEELFGNLKEELFQRLDTISAQIQETAANADNRDQPRVLAAIELATASLHQALNQSEQRLKDQIWQLNIVMANHQVSTKVLAKYQQVTELACQRLENLLRPLQTLENSLSAAPEMIRLEVRTAVEPLQNFERKLDGCLTARLNNFDGIFHRLTRFSFELAPLRTWAVVLIAVLSHSLAFATGLLIYRFLWPH
ncbi:MAG: hypothetical protein IAE82_08805 [Opitutaceae bacterium]|nr:hypothetical protein [Opitutaceae bacterium]